jgi:UDP-3-O-[3-hydroxymyristoyl] N-acetylglucosamine deacetylase
MTKTINQSFQLSGVGLHSGKTTQVTVLPANSGEGRYFVRVDLPEKPLISAAVANVSPNLSLSTELGLKEAKIRTVEHLLAALAGSGIDDVRIEIDGSEVPLLDGSAQIWVEAIEKSGIVENSPENNRLCDQIKIDQPIVINYGDAFVAAFPASETRFTYGIDFPYSAIGNQWYSWQPNRESFAEAIAPARTFGFADQIDQLRQAGLIKGGNLDNALVCDSQGWLNPPLRFPNEPVRHKLLDLVGDLSLLGFFPQAHFLAYKASHKLHIELVSAISSFSDQ